MAAVVEADGDGPLSAGQHLTVLDVVDLAGESGRSQVLDQLASGHVVVLDGESTAGAREQVSDLIATLVPPLSAVVGRGAVLQAHRNAAARTVLAEEFGLLTARQVADLSGSTATNTSATANRWRTNGDVFAVSWEGVTVYPGFQFDDDGRPVPSSAQCSRRSEEPSRDGRWRCGSPVATAGWTVHDPSTASR